MDERSFPCKVGRPIPEWDFRHRLPIDTAVSSDCKDTAAIFRINSTYMDVTDQPYQYRQWQAGGVFIVTFFSALLMATLIKIILIPVSTIGVGVVAVYCTLIGSMIGMAYMAFNYGRDEYFALNRRPIRFNHKEKKIYAIRHRSFFGNPGQGDITWEVPWDENAIFCIHRGVVHQRNVYHIRYYEVDQNNNVTRAFAIGREWEEDESLEDLLSQWNYWCWYMNHGPAELPKPLLFFKEKENILESFLFCLYGFGMRASAAYRISMMPFVLLMTSHRLMALWTCRDPIWPDAVAKVSVIEPDDPFDQPSGNTPVGWAETVHAIDRGEYPDGDKREMKNWSGEKNPALNALLWAKDIPPPTR
ncbi:hypothetical protein GWL_28200 [Herbaspirillum sp. GW103]|uniref:DUF6708 domain-containing protein n=1 Tax=Herbaspirillum sp. GW103 TaxID=1175306 RepID=UPI00025E4E8A|nr:DUF6708 domain-containing protein [Herbaspirillum sp. GW103]EIJ45792.1 hypothetical protein GWL_28200 [Herbaspirillum sp. GW103]